MSDASDLPIWLNPLLASAQAQAPSRFREACREAATAGAGLARMRAVRQAIGPRPVPLNRLVQDLAGAAGASAEVVANWVGLRLEGGPDADSARAWGRLASGLGLSRREARLHLKLSVLEHFGAEPFLQAAARLANPADPLIDAERDAEIQAAELADPALGLLQDCEAAALLGFDDASA